ncbi:MAG: riboflavin synthase alpha chain [Flavipsychrobacter sp.]|nr:riboflavin synthase alpha chain [Flavipsychrobacter sp.]
MFTGIIENMATIADVVAEGTNVHFIIDSPITGELKIDQSVAHNGVCLTVVAIQDTTYTVTAVAETLAKTDLATWQKGDKVNLERALKLGDRLDGHFVQGHVDATATCIEKQTMDGSWLFRFRFAPEYAGLVIEKGSICINGVSLTVFNVGRNECTVTIIPYTYTHTNFHNIEEGSIVNMEFDVLGKYLLRQAELKA